ncbi:unnamed protein product [Zymoseptoria tritici ST99CH_1A5]|uniref:6-methylsalicylate decarboxylase n=3 Tax=Zymoseptoria tritici TaxID=1047171 RepID=A0A1X7RS51_ZYMT9|nr:unnamed protein product [Zymoseptoria tritici ST99CH_3D7]SMR52221.1 unnamed protein product [Zymoseptoria tritici ST99CH_3D1]SMY23896.1 unnamed protein product [Zymoseptoria tritici ST99CH_1A5]
MPTTMPSKIDLHSHFLPPFYRTALQTHGHANPDGMPAVPDWSETSHLALMDKLNISRSILSISSPGTHLIASDPSLAITLTRRCNAYAADLKRRHPSRFGFFASLPLPEIQASLDEIPKAISEDCDGFVLLTNAHGHYLGDEILNPIFEELNRRKAIVFIHPTTPKCPCSTESTAAGGQTPIPATPFAGRFPNPMLEFFFDTARIVTNLFLSGTVQRCPDIKFILPHLGGAFAPLLSRWTGFSGLVPGPWSGVSEEEVKAAFERQFWFDIAGFVFPSQIKGLVEGVGVSNERLVYGSDFPFTKAEGVEMLLGQMDVGVKGMFEEGETENLYHGNAERLLES